MDKDNSKKGVFMERNSLIKLICKKGKGKKVKESVEICRVLSIFDKFYNKWFVSKDDEKEWNKILS